MFWVSRFGKARQYKTWFLCGDITWTCLLLLQRIVTDATFRCPPFDKTGRLFAYCAYCHLRCLSSSPALLVTTLSGLGIHNFRQNFQCSLSRLSFVSYGLQSTSQPICFCWISFSHWMMVVALERMKRCWRRYPVRGVWISFSVGFCALLETVQ